MENTVDSSKRLYGHFLNERQAVCEIQLNRVSWTNKVGLQSAEGFV